MSRAKTLVTGATGMTGSHTVQLLLKRGHTVRVLAHNEDERSIRLQELGAEVAIEDLLNLNDVRLALRRIRGAYLAYLLSPTLVQATAIFAQAAKEAEVEIVANMSQWNSLPSAKSLATINHWLSEQGFDWSAVPVAHLRVTIFSEWLLWVARSIRQGVMMMPWDANSRCSPVATEDLAQVIVAILENPVTHSGKTYPLCGPAETKKPPRLETPAASLRANGRESALNRVAVFTVRIFGGGDRQLHLLSDGGAGHIMHMLRNPSRFTIRGSICSGRAFPSCANCGARTGIAWFASRPKETPLPSPLG